MQFVKYITIGFCLLGLVLAISVSAEPTVDLSVEDGRVQVSRDQIHLTQEGIFINFDGHFLCTEALYVDATGNYTCDAGDWIIYCPLGHPYLFFQSGCSFPGCPFNRDA